MRTSLGTSLPPGGDRPSGLSGFTFELCAGLVDKSKPLECIASEEVLEECGYNVDPARLTSLGCSISSAGITGTKHYMYYAQVWPRAPPTVVLYHRLCVMDYILGHWALVELSFHLAKQH